MNIISQQFSNLPYISPDAPEIEYKKRFLFYKPHEKQLAFHNAGLNAFGRALFGGNRSGKSQAGAIESAMHATGVYPKWWEGKTFKHAVNGWVSSENFETTRNVAQHKILGGYDEEGRLQDGLISPDLIVEKAMLSGVRGAVDYIRVKHVSGGLSTIYFKSYKQGREKFQGSRCHFIWLDEETTIDIYRECLMRLADVDGQGQGILMLTMTPLKGLTELVKHCLYSRHQITSSVNDEVTIEDFKLTPGVILDGKCYFLVSWNDNPYLSEDTKTQLKASIPAYELEAREKGIPLIGTGLVHQIPESAFVIDPIEIKEQWHHVVGLDIGFNPSPTAGVFCAWDKDHGRDIIYIYSEYYITQNTPQQHVYNWQSMDCLWMPFIADPSARIGTYLDGKKAVEEYQKAGKNINLASYSKELSVIKIHERIRTGRFKVFSNCHKFLEEWRSYARDKNGKIMKGNDHLMNALEFVMSDGLPLAKNKSEYRNLQQFGDSRSPSF